MMANHAVQVLLTVLANVLTVVQVVEGVIPEPAREIVDVVVKALKTAVVDLQAVLSKPASA